MRAREWMQGRRERSHNQALDTFVVRKREFDAMLRRLTDLSADHFGVEPDKVDCGHVGTLSHYARLLRQASDGAFWEGEHAGRRGCAHRSRPVPRQRPGLGVVGGRGSVPGQPEDTIMTDFTTAQLATVLSALAGSERKPATKAAAMRAIARHAKTTGRTSEAVLAAAPGLLDGRLDPATWHKQLTAPVEPTGADTYSELANGPSWTPAGVTFRPGTKQALVALLLGREQGATLDELIAATGWLPHTTRAALTGLRRKGCRLEKSTREDGKTAYHIVPPNKAAVAAPSGVA
jgi:hypothetical protein